MNILNTEIMRVSYTPDGDTLRCFRTINSRVEEVRIRLAFIDAPEMNHPPSYTFAVRARAYLRSLLYVNEAVEVRIYGTDVYGRFIAEVIRLRDYGHCGLRLVVGGYAALYQCPADRSEYYAARSIAQSKSAGIWSIPGPWQTPWVTR